MKITKINNTSAGQFTISTTTGDYQVEMNRDVNDLSDEILTVTTPSELEFNYSLTNGDLSGQADEDFMEILTANPEFMKSLKDNAAK